MTYQNMTDNLQQTTVKNGTTSVASNFDLTQNSDLVSNEDNSIDFEQLELIPARPLESEAFLSFEGEPDNNQGFAAFLNSDPDAPDSGHLEISLNAPGNPAPYYATGRESSPLPMEATRSATLDDNQNLSNFSDYLTDNDINLADIGYGFGQKDGRAVTETWNAGDDLLGQDWLASPDSTIEERIFQADPNAVESFLLLDNTKFISFDYLPFYAVFDYGETTGTEDDLEVFLTEAVTAQKVDGLDPFADGLADAFLQDISNNKIQLVAEDSAVDNLTPILDPDTGFVVANVPFPLDLRVVDDDSDTEPVSPKPIFGTLETDSLEIEGSNNLVFAGEGSDLIDASFAGGNNRIYGDGGDDTFILGTGDRLVGAEDTDRFFVTMVVTILLLVVQMQTNSGLLMPIFLNLLIPLLTLSVVKT